MSNKSRKKLETARKIVEQGNCNGILCCMDDCPLFMGKFSCRNFDLPSSDVKAAKAYIKAQSISKKDLLKRIEKLEERIEEDSREGFVQGIVWAAGFMVANHKMDTYAQDIFYQAGISHDEAAKFCYEYILERLRKAIPDLPEGKE